MTCHPSQARGASRVRRLLLVASVLTILPWLAPSAIPSAHADAGATPRRRATRIAVLDLDAATVDAHLARVVTESLLAELRKLDRVSVISYDEVRAMLSFEADRQLLGCDEGASCLAELADAIGADVLITGTLARVGADHVIGLKRISQAEAQATATFNKRVPAGNGEEFLAELGPAVAELFPDVPLREGMERGVSKEVARRLSPPPLPAWALPAGLTASGVALAGAAGAALLQMAFQQEYRELAAGSAKEVVAGSSLVAAGDRAQIAELSGWVLLATGTIAGVATLVALPCIDLAGEREASVATATTGATP